MHTCNLCRVQTLHPQIYWLDVGFLVCGYESIIPFELVATNHTVAVSQRLGINW
jgi:hypothetical protein